jgi:transcriptional antiterminator RfaH
MAALLQRADPSTGLHRDDQAMFRSGDLVKLVDGPLAGLQGVFSQKDGDERVIVLFELLGKANKLRISRDWIARAA